MFGLSAGVNNRWAIGVRAGTMITTSTLVYAKVGYTKADIDFVGDTDGIVWGGGAEMELSGPVHLQADYSYVDYDAISFGPVAIDADQHVVRVGVLYKINWTSSSTKKPYLK